MFDNVMPPETLQLGSGYQGLGLRESRGYGGVGTGKRERERERDLILKRGKVIGFWFCRESKWRVFEIFSGPI